MILTDLDFSILFAIAAGSISGFFSSALENTLIIKLDGEIILLKRIIIGCLRTAFFYGIILGVGVFIESLDTNITITQLNHSSIALAIYISIYPLYHRLTSFIFSQFRKGKTNLD